MDYDVLVIGAGYGGLTAASILAKRGFRVCLLEAHTSVGGCAGHFKRKNFLFDAGATTLSGVLPHQPLGRVFIELGIQPNLHHEQTGMMIRIGEQWISRYADRAQWVEESVEKFNVSNVRGYQQFWDELYAIESRVWELTQNNYALPPSSLRDVLSLVQLSNLKGLSLLPTLFTPISTLMRKYDLLENQAFVRFADQQLLISTQNTHRDAPLATAAMGLVYPSETYYPVGGMIAPAQLLANAVVQNGSVVKLKHRVQSISRIAPKGYAVAVEKGGARPEQFSVSARCVISNATLWNMRDMTTTSDAEMHHYFGKKSKKIHFAWGAFMLYCAVQTAMELPTAYYQIHTRKPIPFCESDSFFITFSQSGDTAKAPHGWRTLTISTHTPVSAWQHCTEQEYTERKHIVERYIMDELHRVFPDIRMAEYEHILTATPKSFAFFTRREQGYVGGVPHSVKHSLLSIAPNTTPFEHLYMVGDTVFPGQGTPAVALGALNVAERVSRFL
jgi:C-3',4' desaturase CrtD